MEATGQKIRDRAACGLMTIDIAVPTYNCSRWIDAFMNSILTQDDQDWRIVTRDDGSSDDTAERVAAWAKKFGERLMILPNETKENLGPVGSYNCLLGATTAPWVMLADPDDEWKPSKIRISLATMRSAEAESNVPMPVIAFCDAEVIDEAGQKISRSYWQWSRQTPRPNQQFSRTLVDSAAISSGMIVNRAVLDKALPIAGSYSSQDWWLLLVATAFGKVMVIPDTLFRYRRHGYNDSQAPLTSTFVSGLRNLPKAHGKLEKLLRGISLQARVFYTRFDPTLSPVERRALRVAMHLPSENWLKRRFLIVRHKLFFSSTLKNVAMLLFL